MIIAAYAGTGKSTFAQRVGRAADLPIMPFSWILPPTEKTDAELEEEKGALHRLRDPRFPDNYLAEILKAERTSRFVLIPTDFEVVRRLREEYGRKVLLCYPDEGCREEYRMRFLARGNSESFLGLFIDGWDHFLEPVRNYERGIHIVMRPGAYLTDLLPRLEEERQSDTTEPVDGGTIRNIEERLAGRNRNLLLCLRGDGRRCFYPIRDLDAPEERWFLDRIGRVAFECDPGLIPFLAPKEMFPPETLTAFTTEDQREVLSFVRNSPRFEPEKLKTRPDEEDAVR